MKKLKKILYDEMYEVEIKANGIVLICIQLAFYYGLAHIFIDLIKLIVEEK